MKKYMKISPLVLTGILLVACGNKQQTEVTTSNNLFSTLLGKRRTSLRQATSASMMPTVRNASIMR